MARRNPPSNGALPAAIMRIVIMGGFAKSQFRFLGRRLASVGPQSQNAGSMRAHKTRRETRNDLAEGDATEESLRFFSLTPLFDRIRSALCNWIRRTLCNDYFRALNSPILLFFRTPSNCIAFLSMQFRFVAKFGNLIAFVTRCRKFYSPKFEKKL